MNKKKARRVQSVVAIGKSDYPTIDEFFSRLCCREYNAETIGFLRGCHFRILTAQTGSCYSLVAAVRKPNESLRLAAKREITKGLELNPKAIILLDMWDNPKDVDIGAIYFGMVYNGTVVQDTEKTRFHWLTPDEISRKVSSGDWLIEQRNTIREFLELLPWLQCKVERYM